MKTYLMTGCAGFIGSNMVLYMLKKYTDIKIINLDALTYAGNMENLKDVEGDERHVFVHGDIGDKELVSKLIREYDPDYDDDDEGERVFHYLIVFGDDVLEDSQDSGLTFDNYEDALAAGKKAEDGYDDIATIENIKIEKIEIVEFDDTEAA